MKSILVYVLSFAFLFTSCISEKIVDTSSTEKGSVSVSLDKNNSPKEIVKIVIVLERDGFETIEKSINLTDNTNASFSSTNLPSGVWHVIVQTLNKDNDILYSGETDISIQPNFNITVFLQFNLNTGTLTLNVSLGDTTSKNLIAFYPFYGNANDFSGLDNNGIVYGAELTKDRFGNNNGAYYFDGIDDYIRITDDNSLTPSNQKLTLAAWIKTLGTNNKAILYKGDMLNNREYALGFSSKTMEAGFSIFDRGMGNEGQSDVGSKEELKNNEWYFIVGTWDGSEMKIYINGRLTNSKTTNATIGNFDSDLFIGTYGGNIQKHAFKGIIDDIAIFNKPLSSTEIEHIYHATK